MALNDEAGSVRALAISVVGRLASLNPGYILPAARKHLIQLLNDMEHSPDSRQRQGVLSRLLLFRVSLFRLTLPRHLLSSHTIAGQQDAPSRFVNAIQVLDIKQ